MLPIAYYFLKVTLCSGILFGYYWLFLRNKVYHQYNRFFLLTSFILSLVLPLLRIGIWQSGTEAPSQAIQLLQVVSSGDDYMQDIVIRNHQENISLSQLSSVLYLLVCLVFFCGFIHVIYKIRRLIYKYKGQIIEQFFFVNTTAKGTPFSFLNYIFWNDAIDIETTTGRQIFKHEVAHIREKHSYDKLFINIVLIACWFNPFFWLMRKELNMIHEFVADKKAIADSDAEAFAAMILQAAYPQHKFELVNNFFYSPVKRRLLMLTKNKNPRVGYFSRVLALPVAAFVIAAFSFKTKPGNQVPLTSTASQRITVVIDAGHGGKDGGSRSITGNLYEKDITLNIARKVKELNTDNNINILLSREDDTYKTPQERVEFAKANNASLFISIHTDAAGSDSAEYKSGMSVYVAKNSVANAAESKVLASAIIGQFRNNYQLQVIPFPMQRQTGIWVLQSNECPAAIIEAGYITNKKDFEYLQTDLAQERIARNILAAISQYSANTSRVVEVKDVLNRNIKVVQGQPVSEIKKYPDTLIWLKNESGQTNGVINLKKTANPPLYLLNGEEIGYGEDAAKKLDKLVKPDDIGSINVLKDKPATDKYGDKGKNGVIEIITKKKIEEQATELNNLKEVTVAGYSTQRDKSSAQARSNTPVTEPLVVAGYPLPKENTIFDKVETEAEFPGGQAAWQKYLGKNLDASLPVKEGWKPGTYRVIVQFVVKADGSLSDIKAVNYSESKTAAACISLIAKGPKWLPAVQNGRPVTSYRNQPIIFVVEDGDTKPSNVYSVPLKAHLVQDGKIITYNMLTNGTFSKDNQLYYLNGKPCADPSGINSKDVLLVETYDPASAKQLFGEKGRNGINFIKTKS